MDIHSIKKRNNEGSREQIIVRTSIIGIVANVFLSAFKLVVGTLTNSIAIVSDAINNISDAGSSLVTIVGTKLAAKEPDKKHPFGYGRIEYLTAMIIAVLVLYAGIASLIESIKSIMEPDTPNYTPVSLIIVAVAVMVKFVLGLYVKKTGQKVNSDSLINSGKDASLDAVISASTLVAAAIYIFFHISLEAWLGAIISVVIIKSGVDMLKETISQLLGERNDLEQSREIKKTILEFPEVKGVYDLVLNNYGPETWTGSVHIEVPDTCNAADLDQLMRDIQVKVYKEHRVILTAVGIYSLNTTDQEVITTREEIRRIAFSHKYVTQMHGFYLIEEKKAIRFDLVVSLGAKNRKEVFDTVVAEVQKAYPDYQLEAAMDTDYAEE